MCGGRTDPEKLAPHMKMKDIHESRQPSHMYYKRDMRTGIAVPAKTPWTQKADKYSYSKQSTFKGGDFEDSVTQKDYADPSDFTGPRAPKPIVRHVRGGKKGRSKMNKLGYTSQVANCVFNHGEKASIHLGTDRGFPKHSEMSSQFTGGRPHVRQSWQWKKNTHDAFTQNSFNTKPPHQIHRTGMTHPAANTKTKPNEQTHYTAVHGAGCGKEAPLSTFRNGAGARLGGTNTNTAHHGLGHQYEL